MATILLVGGTCFVVSTVMAWVAVIIIVRKRVGPNPRVVPPPLPSMKSRLAKPHKVYPSLNASSLFDYFRTRPDSDLQTLFRDQLPVNGAAMLRFVPPDQRARILKGLTRSDKAHIDTLAEELCDRPGIELIRVSDKTRRRITHSEIRGPKNDIDFWTQTLERTGAQFALLDSLEKTRPDLKPVIENFRKKIDEALEMPRERMRSILARISDKELALALTNCPKNIADNVIKELSLDRKNRILHRIRTQGVLTPSMTAPATKKLFKRLREAVL